GGRDLVLELRDRRRHPAFALEVAVVKRDRRDRAHLDRHALGSQLRGRTQERGIVRARANAAGNANDPHQNIVLPCAACLGTTCRTSQCSTIFPLSSKRKMSIPAHSSSPGHCCWQCRTT